MLDKLISDMADAYEREGGPIDGELGGAVHQWATANCNMRPDQSFFVVFLLTAELADREARREGFDSQAHRAACRAFGNRARAVKHVS